MQRDEECPCTCQRFLPELRAILEAALNRKFHGSVGTVFSAGSPDCDICLARDSFPKSFRLNIAFRVSDLF